MNILAIVGSPRRRGNTSTIIETICEAAGEAGHECDIQHIYDYDLNGCRACGKCKSGEVELCAQDDDMAELLLRVINSDCLIFGSPVYMGQVTGPAKTFLDRFYAFSTKGFGVRYLEGKKLITVITGGAPAEKYKSVEEYLHRLRYGRRAFRRY